MNVIDPWLCFNTLLIWPPLTWLPVYFLTLMKWWTCTEAKDEETVSRLFLWFLSSQISLGQEGAQTQSEQKENAKLAVLSDVWPLVFNKWGLCTCLSPSFVPFFLGFSFWLSLCTCDYTKFVYSLIFVRCPCWHWSCWNLQPWISYLLSPLVLLK